MVDQNTSSRGNLVWFSSDEDSGPDCGISLGLGDGHAIFIGEMADRTLEDSGVVIADIIGGSGWWLALETPSALSVVGPVVDMENAREMMDRLFSALHSKGTEG